MTDADKELMEVAEACAAQRCTAPMEDYLEAKRDAIPAQPDLSLLQRYYIGDVSHALPLRNGAYVLFNDVETMLNRMSGGAAVTDEAKDAARFRAAIALEDNAETLLLATINHTPDADAIRAEFDAAIEAQTQGREQP